MFEGMSMVMLFGATAMVMGMGVNMRMLMLMSFGRAVHVSVRVHMLV